jgi:hypothetical protein
MGNVKGPESRRKCAYSRASVGSHPQKSFAVITVRTPQKLRKSGSNLPVNTLHARWTECRLDGKYVAEAVSGEIP